MDSKVKTLCSNCNGTTNHDVVSAFKVVQPDGPFNANWEYDYQIIRCCGCETVSFRLYCDDWDMEEHEECKAEHRYPDPTTRPPIEGAYNFPAKTFTIYNETLTAFSNDAPILAAIGLRALIESICIDRKTTARTLEKAIDELATQGLLSGSQAEFLHNHRFMGNVAAHELVAPDRQDFLIALDIAETLLKTIYIIPKSIKQMKKASKTEKQSDLH